MQHCGSKYKKEAKRLENRMRNCHPDLFKVHKREERQNETKAVFEEIMT